jgi:hypothetical protein
VDPGWAFVRGAFTKSFAGFRRRPVLAFTITQGDSDEGITAGGSNPTSFSRDRFRVKSGLKSDWRRGISFLDGRLSWAEMMLDSRIPSD